METFPLRLESRTIALLDPSAEGGESALDLLEPTDHHVSLLVLLHGTASQALHEFARSAEIDLTEAAEIYLDQVAQRIERDGRSIERVVAQGPDPMSELRDLAATGDVAKVLVPAASKPLDGWLFNMRAQSGSGSFAHLRKPARSKRPFHRSGPSVHHLAVEEQRCIEQHGTLFTVPGGATIIRRGEPGRHCLVVIDGHLRVMRDGEVVAELDAGAIAGEMALLTGKPCNADVVTTENSAVLALTKSELDAVLESCPQMADRVYKTAVLRMGAIA